MSVLEELYYGGINPNERKYKKGTAYAENIKAVCDSRDKLTDFLKTLPDSERGQELLTQIINTQTEILVVSEKEMFIEGFILGAGIMLEILRKPESVFEPA